MEFDYFIIFIFLLEVNLLDKLKWINEWEWCKYVWVFKLRKSFGAQARRSVRRWETTRLRRGQIFKDPQRSRASLDLNPEARGAIDFLFLSYSPSLFRLTSRFLLLAVAFVYNILISLLRICPGLRKPYSVRYRYFALFIVWPLVLTLSQLRGIVQVLAKHPKFQFQFS